MQTSAIAPSVAAGNSAADPRVERSAVEFESVFLSQMLQGMSKGIAGTAGLGDAEGGPWAQMLQDEYARLIARSGGIGIAGSVMRELLADQEMNAGGAR